MVFGISDELFLDKHKLKLINGPGGSAKSSQSVSNLKKLGEKFCMLSFSNALKFAASDRFGCDTDTICGLCFVNTPYPRYEEKPISEFSTVILDEILLDGAECLKWIRHNVGKVNIIALTDSHQMLNAENSEYVLKEFDKISKLKSTIYVELTESYRPRNDETKKLYDELYQLNSRQLFSIDMVQKIFNCDIISIDDVDFNNQNAYICHSNRIEHEIYKRYDLSSNRGNNLIPKNHISRNRTVDFNRYPICDQLTATEKKIGAYLQHANVGTPTRYQGREIEVGDQCYFIVEPSSMFTGREIYTVGTRCKDMKSLHIVLMNIEDYKDPRTISNIQVVEAKRLDIPDHSKEFKNVDRFEMRKIIKQYGEVGVYYHDDIITSGDFIIYSTHAMSKLSEFADITNEKGVIQVKYRKKKAGAKRSIRSIAKQDPTMHFDFLPKVYSILNAEVKPARINSPKRCRKGQFDRLCDIYSAFPTILHNAPMPKAGLLYEEYDEDLLNFYVYEGNVVTKGSLITEDLAKRLGESRYVFSTAKQTGCELGHYTYEQCKASKEKKAEINKNFLWGILEKDYYKLESLVLDGESRIRFVKSGKNNLELISCALWSALSLVMLDAINSINAKDFVVVTDGLYYNGDKRPQLPEWCDYRIENEHKARIYGKDKDKKYDYIEYQSYSDPKTNKQVKAEKQRKKRAELSPEEAAAKRAKNAERMRIARAKKKAADE